MKKRALALMLCLVIALMCLSTGAAVASADDDGEKILRIAVSSDLLTLDPQDHAHEATDSMFSAIGNRLFRRAGDMSIVPDLVTEYEIVDDTTWKMTIRDDAVFSNGDKLTSKDVKFSIERAATDTALIEYNFFKDITGVEIIDDYTFNIKTAAAKPDLLSLLAKSGGDIMPADYIESVGMEEYIRDPILSGQYKLLEWIPNDHYTLVPNETYFGEPGIWDQIIVRPIPESSTRVAELLTGGVDIIDNVPPNEWDRVNESGTASIVTGETSRILLLNVRLTDGYVTADPLVREAIECAIDKNLICNELLKGAGIPTRTRVGNGVVGFNDDLFGPEKGDIYDPERAKELLAEAGYADGLELTLTASRGRYVMDSEIAEMISAMLTQVGITVNLEMVESSVLSDMWTAHTNEELFMIALSDSQYDAAYPLIHYGDKDRVAGLTDYDSAECQELYEAALCNMDLEERAEQMKQIQAIAAEDRPHICIAQMSSLYGVSNNVSFTPRLDACYVPNEITPAA